VKSKFRTRHKGQDATAKIKQYQEKVVAPSVRPSEMHFTSSDRYFTSSDGRVTAWMSKQGYVAEQADRGYAPISSPDKTFLHFGCSYLNLQNAEGLDLSRSATINVLFKTQISNTETPLVILSKGNYNSEIIYMDILHNKVRVKFGKYTMEEFDISKIHANWISVTCHHSNGAFIWVDQEKRNLDTFLGMGSNDAPLLLGARAELLDGRDEANKYAAKCILRETGIKRLFIDTIPLTPQEVARNHLLL